MRATSAWKIDIYIMQNIKGERFYGICELNSDKRPPILSFFRTGSINDPNSQQDINIDEKRYISRQILLAVNALRTHVKCASDLSISVLTASKQMRNVVGKS